MPSCVNDRRKMYILILLSKKSIPYCKNQVATKEALIYTIYKKQEREPSSLSRLKLQSIMTATLFQ